MEKPLISLPDAIWPPPYRLVVGAFSILEWSNYVPKEY